jgi:hypothetical protein
MTRAEDLVSVDHQRKRIARTKFLSMRELDRRPEGSLKGWQNDCLTVGWPSSIHNWPIAPAVDQRLDETRRELRDGISSFSSKTPFYRLDISYSGQALSGGRRLQIREKLA